MSFPLRAARGLTSSLRLLTAIPIPGDRTPRAPGALTTAWFPAVGLLLGGALAPLTLLPLPDAARGALLLAAWTGLTGALHEDGWADVADAALAPVSRDERLRILKDPRVGAHGLTATVLLLLLRFGALAAVSPAAVLAAPVVGRWAMALSLALAPTPVPDGLGARYGRRATALAPTIVALAALAAVGAGTGVRAPLAAAWAAGAGSAGWVAAFLHRRLGGLNGDAHGAVGLAAETTALWALLPLA